jgi:hypothetical protein
VFAAVADLRPQHFLGRRQADRGLLVEHRVHFAHEPFRFGARVGRAAGDAPRLLDNFRVVTFDERLRLQVAQAPGIRRTRRERARIRHVEHGTGHVLRGAGEVEAGQVHAAELHLEAHDIGGFGHRHAQRGNDGRGLQHVGAHARRYGQLLRLFGRFAHRHQPQRTLLAHDGTGIGDPRGGREARVGEVHLEGRQRRPLAATISRSCTRTFTGWFESVAGSNTISSCVAPALRPALASRRAMFSMSAGGAVSVRFGAFAAGAADGDREREAVHRARQRQRSGARVEREVERAQQERLVHARGRADGGRVVAPRSDICRRPSPAVRSRPRPARSGPR